MQQTEFISSLEAVEYIAEAMPQMGSESVPLIASRGRVLAEEVSASEDIPKHANSSMDGFAILDQTTQDASESHPVLLKVAGEAAAGRPFQGEWDPSTQAIRIMTGAVVPEGSNAVIELELAHEDGDHVSISTPVARGKNIRLAGEDVRRGEQVIPKGILIEPEDIGVLAAIGYDEIGVSRKPSVTVITTGSELVDPRSVLGPGMVRNSSLFMVPAYVEAAGGTVAQAVSVGDDREQLKKAILAAFETDIVITTGGISVGKYDLVRPVLEELNVEIRFSGVNIKPGKPMTFGVAPNGTPVFCLPGNPVSTAVTFLRFVRPGIENMIGLERQHSHLTHAILEEEIVKKDLKEHFLRGVFTPGETLPSVRRTGTQSSGALSSMARANCLIVLPAEMKTFEAGEQVEIIPL